MVKVGAIILARSNSNRFQKKHLAMLHGQPMIYWLIKTIAKTCTPYLCTTTDRSDDDLADYCESIGAKVYRGPEDHLQKRIIGCYMTHELDGVLHISGDCIFTQDKAIKAMYKAMHDHPGYWIYGYEPILHANLVEGLTCTGRTLPYELYKLEKLPSMIGTKRGLVREDQPSIDPPETIPGTGKRSAFMVSNDWEPDETPLKTSIDYPCELDFWNKVCGHLGRFPKDYDDIRRAVQTIRL